jgi:heat-inducible transcriptional repressor
VSLGEEPLWTLDLVALAERRALMVLGIGGGGAHSLVLELESDLDARELEEVSAVLRERLLLLPLADVRWRLAQDPELARDSAVRIVTRAAFESWAQPVSTPIFSAGAVHIAEQPEFRGSAELVPILRVIEEGSPLDRLMITGIEGQVAVRVGLDESPSLAGCSLVSFALTGTVRGAVGILGPRRMDYSRVLPVVETIGNQVADLLHS